MRADGRRPSAASDNNHKPDDPHGTVMLPDGVTDTVVCDVHSGPQGCYYVDTAELRRLIEGQPPSDGAPDGFYFYQPAWWVIVRGGAMVGAHTMFLS